VGNWLKQSVNSIHRYRHFGSVDPKPDA